MPKKLQLLVPLVGPEGPQGPQGETGSAGKDGATFKPSVTEDGVLSWTNDKGLDNPTPVTIKNSGIHIGAEEPTNPNANIWILPDEEVEEPTDDTVYIPAPEAASVGQTIVVKAVDENGRPTEWEAADFPAGGGGEGSCTEWEFIGKTTTEEEVSSIQIINENPLNELLVRYTVPSISEDPGGTVYARPVFIENGAVVANINAYAGIKKPSTKTHRCNWHITPLSAIRYEWNASAASPPTIVAVAEEPMERIRNAYSNGGGLVGFALYWNQDKTFPVGTSLEVWGR